MHIIETIQSHAVEFVAAGSLLALLVLSWVSRMSREQAPRFAAERAEAIRPGPLRAPAPVALSGLASFTTVSATSEWNSGHSPVTAKTARAMDILSPALANAGANGGAFLAEDDLGERIAGDLLLVGGPKSNRVTKELLAEIGSTLPFSLKEPYVVDASGKILFESEYDETDGTPLTCYGLLVRTRNPHDPTKSVVILAGNHSIGTTAAAKAFVANQSRFASGDFAAIVEADVVDGAATKGRLVKSVQLG